MSSAKEKPGKGKAEGGETEEKLKGKTSLSLLSPRESKRKSSVLSGLTSPRKSTPKANRKSSMRSKTQENVKSSSSSASTSASTEKEKEKKSSKKREKTEKAERTEKTEKTEKEEDGDEAMSQSGSPSGRREIKRSNSSDKILASDRRMNRIRNPVMSMHSADYAQLKKRGSTTTAAMPQRGNQSEMIHNAPVASPLARRTRFSAFRKSLNLAKSGKRLSEAGDVVDAEQKAAPAPVKVETFSRQASGTYIPAKTLAATKKKKRPGSMYLKGKISNLGKKSSLSSSASIRSPRHASAVDLSSATKTTIDATVKVQTVIRCFLVRRRLACVGSKTQRSTRFLALKELSINEKKVSNLLKSVIELYLKPIRTISQSNGTQKSTRIPTLSPEAESKIFFNVEDLFRFHYEFSQSLEACVKHWPACDVSSVLLGKFQTMCALYESFAVNLHVSETELAVRVAKDPILAGYLDEMSLLHQKTGHRTLKSLLGSPMAHLHTYAEYCKALLFHTPRVMANGKPAAAYGRMLSATAIIVTLPGCVAANVDSRDTRAVLVAIGDKKLEHYRPRMQFIREGYVRIDGVNRRLFLFNDVLLLCASKGRKDTSSSKGTRLKLTETVLLQGAAILRMEQEQKKGGSSVLEFAMKTPSKSIYSCQEKSTFEDSCAKTVHDYIRHCNDIVFGASLSSVLEREAGDVPQVVLRCLYFLSKVRDKSEMFRADGNPNVVSRLRSAESANKPSDFTNCFMDDIAQLLTLYLEMLPAPLLPFVGIDPVYSLDRLPSTEECLEYLTSAVGRMDRQHQNLFEYLIYFLTRIYGDGEGQANLEEVCLFLAPAIIRPVEDISPIYCSALPVIVELLKTAVLFSGKLFGGSRTGLVEPSDSKLPKTVKDFLLSDNFCVWWKDFRAGERSFMAYITSPAVVKDLISCLSSLKEPPYLPSTAGQEANQCAVTATNVLTSDIVAAAIVAEPEHLFNFIGALTKTNLPRSGSKALCEALGAIFAAQPNACAQFFLDNVSLSKDLMSRIGCGNVLDLFGKLCKEVVRHTHSTPEKKGSTLSKAESKDKKHECLQCLWATQALEQVLSLSFSSTEGTMSNTAALLCILLEDVEFLAPEKNYFFDRIKEKDLMAALVKKVLEGKEDEDTKCILVDVLMAFVTIKLTQQTSLSTGRGWLAEAEDQQLTSLKKDRTSTAALCQMLAQEYSEVSVATNDEEEDEEEVSDDSLDLTDSGEDLDDEESTSDDSDAVTPRKLVTKAELERSGSESAKELQGSGSGDRVEVGGEEKPRLLRTGSFSWVWRSTRDLSVVNKQVDSICGSTVTLVMHHQDKIRDLLRPESDSKTLGKLRFYLVKLVQSLILVDSPVVTVQLTMSDVVDACLKLFFRYPHHSILHQLVTGMVMSGMDRGDEVLITHFVAQTSLLPECKTVLCKETEAGYQGHLRQILTALRKNEYAMKTIKEETDHSELMQELLARLEEEDKVRKAMQEDAQRAVREKTKAAKAARGSFKDGGSGSFTKKLLGKGSKKKEEKEERKSEKAEEKAADPGGKEKKITDDEKKKKAEKEDKKEEAKEERRKKAEKEEKKLKEEKKEADKKEKERKEKERKEREEREKKEKKEKEERERKDKKEKEDKEKKEKKEKEKEEKERKDKKEKEREEKERKDKKEKEEREKEAKEEKEKEAKKVEEKESEVEEEPLAEKKETKREEERRLKRERRKRAMEEEIVLTESNDKEETVKKEVQASGGSSPAKSSDADDRKESRKTKSRDDKKDSSSRKDRKLKSASSQSSSSSSSSSRRKRKEDE